MSESPDAAPGVPADAGDLGFTFRARRSGDVEVLHHGRLAATLRGADAARFLARVEAGTPADAQQWMARVTGNYRRGNERVAAQHPRQGG